MSVNFTDWYITPKHRFSDYKFPLNLEQKITIFFERIDGWQLKIAGLLINGIYDKNGKLINQSESSYAVLRIIFSFFEMIAKYEDGYIELYRSKDYFKKGVVSIFPEAKNHPELLTSLYHGVRCGLYHSANTHGKVFLEGDLKGAIAFTKNKKVLINPQILVKDLQNYLTTYVENLRNTKKKQLRDNFEKRFDFDNSFELNKC